MTSGAFLKGRFSLCVEKRVLCLQSKGWKISDVYSRDKWLKNLNMPTQIHCETHKSSQLIFLNSSIPLWALLSRLKQYLIHLFWDVWIFLKVVYLARATKQSRYNFSEKDFSLPLTKPGASVAVDSPERLLSRTHPSKLPCCAV